MLILKLCVVFKDVFGCVPLPSRFCDVCLLSFSLSRQERTGERTDARRGGAGEACALIVTRSRDFARKWRFLKAARALKIGPRALREF